MVTVTEIRQSLRTWKQNVISLQFSARQGTLAERETLMICRLDVILIAEASVNWTVK